MTALVLQAEAQQLPLPDSSVDLIITSPPYFALRSYQDGGEHYAGQIGSEATPAEFLDALWTCTREWCRVLKPSGSLFVNLGDKYSQRVATRRSSHQDGLFPDRPELVKDWKRDRAAGLARMPYENVTDTATGQYVPEKSLMGLPWRYAIGCIDQLGLILRAEIVWAKPNGLPESVTDRVRRSHEQWFHMVKQPRYFSAVDEIREPHLQPDRVRADMFGGRSGVNGVRHAGAGTYTGPTNSLGKLPGSVWEIPSEPLTVPAHLGVDHFAAFPTAWPKRLILGWSPSGICTACGEGRRPLTLTEYEPTQRTNGADKLARNADNQWQGLTSDAPFGRARSSATITGYACACPDTSAPTRPAVVLDPFGGTGTTAAVASALGRIGISVDLSHDYSRLAQWRTTDPATRAKIREERPPATQAIGQDVLW